jgi:hypothetical protein
MTPTSKQIRQAVEKVFNKWEHIGQTLPMQYVLTKSMSYLEPVVGNDTEMLEQYMTIVVRVETYLRRSHKREGKIMIRGGRVEGVSIRRS